MIQNHTQPKHKCRQQGHVAHKNTLDSRPQSNLFLLFLPPLLFDPFSFCFFSASAFSPSSTLRHTVVSLSHIYTFSYGTVAHSLLPPACHVSDCFPSFSAPLFLSCILSLLSLLLLSVCLTAVVGFCVALFLFFVFFLRSFSFFFLGFNIFI